jgi:uncharacterized protein YyaL (SSP411 family)
MVNGLAQERSAYLRQHRTNPVNWLPWGEAALNAATTFNKPILLSIGYSACHWCHVMARESFEDPETAALMNQGFVNIKVDREERPDLDALYVKALQAMGRRPGWPLTMFLTPDGVPFWGGAYFPHEAQNGLPSFREVLEYVSDAYRSDPQGVTQKGRALIDALMSRPTNGERRATITDDSAQAAAAEALKQTDQKNGGLEGAPKFPYPAVFAFLWNQGVRSGRRDFCAAAGFTLERIAASGLYDHVGGGFFRYTVDAEWKIPHFEKMLYDNALLISLYSELYRSEAVALRRDLVRRTVEWLLREMRVADTAFASSLAAESEGREGAYYLLDPTEVYSVLGDAADEFRAQYLDSSADFEGGKVLNRLGEASPERNQEPFLAHCDRLLGARRRRPRPECDEKIVADWNGLAIAALVQAAVVFDEPRWLEAARTAFAFVADAMTVSDTLHHAWNGGQLGAPGILDDYAHMSLAALRLLEATGEVHYLRQAAAWTRSCIGHFADPNGGFFHTADNVRHLVARIRDGHDGATPSGNGIMGRVLSELFLSTGDTLYRRAAQELFESFATDLERDGFLLASIIDAAQFNGRATQVTIIGRRHDPATRALWQLAQQRAPADRWIAINEPGEELPEGHPARGKPALGGRPTAYVCQGPTCSLPITDPGQLARLLIAGGPEARPPLD